MLEIEPRVLLLLDDLCLNVELTLALIGHSVYFSEYDYSQLSRKLEVTNYLKMKLKHIL